MTNTRRSFITKTAIAAAMAPFASLSKTFGQGLEKAIERTPKTSSPADLKITDVKCGYSGGRLFVKISTNQDIGDGAKEWMLLAELIIWFKILAGSLTEESFNSNLIFEAVPQGAFFGVHNLVCL